MKNSTTARMRLAAASVTTVLALGGLSACGSSSDSDSAGDGPLSKSANIDAPSDPGSGYDQTARAIEKALTDEDLAGRVQVTNTPGAGGTVALSQYVQGDDPSDLMIGGLSLVGAVITNKSDVKLSAATPIARLIGEYEVIVVPGDSEFDNLKDFLDAVAEDPGANPIAIGNQGGVDHMWGGTLVKEAGVEPTDVNFVTFDGGAEVTTALLGNQVSAGISGYAEFAQQIEAGELKPLAVSSPEPLEIAPDVPTVGDAGYPDAELVNWRGIFAPPGISDEDRKSLSDTFAELNDSTAWSDLREENGWSDQFLDSDDFTEQLSTEETDAQTLLEEVGLA
jgi:putative tricarboxylic transport membrane protein